MLEFMRTGGLAMWIILALGLGCLGLASSYLWQPAERKLAMLRPLSLAMVFAILSGLCAGLAATTKYVSSELADLSQLPVIVLIGIGETLTNGILGFSLLMLVWLLTAIGMRRSV